MMMRETTIAIAISETLRMSETPIGQTTYQRLALFLLDFMRIPGFFDAQHSRLNLPVNRFDLADYLGMTRETAARAFARLEDEGLIRRADSHTIEILSMNGLKQLHRGRPRKRAAAQR
jgi:CRP-like cAMP-binding protein